MSDDFLAPHSLKNRLFYQAENFQRCCLHFHCVQQWMGLCCSRVTSLFPCMQETLLAFKSKKTRQLLIICTPATLSAFHLPSSSLGDSPDTQHSQKLCLKDSFLQADASRVQGSPSFLFWNARMELELGNTSAGFCCFRPWRSEDGQTDRLRAVRKSTDLHWSV